MERLAIGSQLGGGLDSPLLAGRGGLALRTTLAGAPDATGLEAHRRNHGATKRRHRDLLWVRTEGILCMT